VLYDRHVLLVDFTRFGQVRSEYTRSHLLSTLTNTSTPHRTRRCT
jgi:hypothetical protein